MKKLCVLLLTVLILCAGCGGDGKKLDVKNAEPPNQVEIKNPKIEAIQDAKLKLIAKEIDVNLKKNDAIAGFNKIKFAKNGLGEKDFSTTNVIVELQCDKSKSLTRKKVFDALAVAFKSIYKDQQIKNASITLVDADNDNICTLELDRETEKQITWEQADKMKDWNKIAELFVEYPKMRRL